MRIAAWNVNNRVGKTAFRPEAVDAAMALGADVLVFNEFFPKDKRAAFETCLSAGGYVHQLMSPEPPEVANRVLIASKVLIDRDPYPRPTFDAQLPANLEIARIRATGLRIIGIRVPFYKDHQKHLTQSAWDWLRDLAAATVEDRVAIIGDLNCSPDSPPRYGSRQFKEMLASGWKLGTPPGQSYYNSKNEAASTPDQLLVTPRCTVRAASFVSRSGAFELAGSKAAISDHAALVAEVAVAD